MFIGGGLLLWFSIRYELLTITIVKNDFNDDLKWLIKKAKRFITNIKN